MNYADSFQKVQTHLDSLSTPLKARMVTRLNDGWRFYAGDAAAWAPEYDDGGWRQLSIPHDWSVEGEISNRHPSSGSGGWVQTGVVWYRKHFNLPEIAVGRKFSVLFDGVSMLSSVWINGHFLGTHPYGFTPFWYDITPWVRAGENVLAVKADTSLQPYSRFYHGTGIFRPVSLVSTDALHIEQWGVAAVTKDISSSNAELEVSTKMRVGAYPETKWFGFGTEPQQEAEKQCTLLTTVIDSNGNEAARVETVLTVANYTSHDIRQVISVPKPKLWSEDSPTLYRICSALIIDGETIDDMVTPLGIRQVTWGAAEGFAVNGMPVKLKGVCLHQDSGPWGGAVPVKTWVRKLLTLKEMGCNAVRTAHHPFPAEFYHCCDRLGMMVMDESFDE